MGQNTSQVLQQSDSFEDPENMIVVIEKSPLSKVSDDAAGMYILPKSTNSMNLADLIISLVKNKISLYIGGQEVSHNRTPISMLSSLLENDCLQYIYADPVEEFEGIFPIEEYVKPVEIDHSGPLRIILRPKESEEGPVKKIKIGNECTIRQLELIVERLIEGKIENGVKLYSKERRINGDEDLGSLQKLVEVDGVIHLTYKKARKRNIIF